MWCLKPRDFIVSFQIIRIFTWTQFNSRTTLLFGPHYPLAMIVLWIQVCVDLGKCLPNKWYLLKNQCSCLPWVGAWNRISFLNHLNNELKVCPSLPWVTSGNIFSASIIATKEKRRQKRSGCPSVQNACLYYQVPVLSHAFPEKLPSVRHTNVNWSNPK